MTHTLALVGRLVIVGHFQTCPLEAALDVETLVGLGTVQDALVATGALSDEVQRLDHLQTELLSLLVLCNCNILNMARLAQVVDAMG